MRAALLVLLAAAACSTGYRTPEESEPLRTDLDDRTIESRVRVALSKDELTRSEAIAIQCIDGAVYLRGDQSASSEVAARAKSLALGVEGVRRVIVRFAD